MIQFFLIIMGLVGLWAGALLAVTGAIQLSERYGLSHGFIGLAILAIGTDLPELVVALSGSAQQLQGIEASGVIIGSALGSAIAQGSLVLGVAGLIAYLPVAPRMVRRDGLTLVLCIGLTAALAADGRVTRLDGAAMLMTYVIYLVSLWQGEKSRTATPEADSAGRISPGVAIALGLIMVTLGAHVAVTEALVLASALGMSQTLLGVVFIGVGTSLPELALSIRAAKDQHSSLAVGNVLGSNIFDLLVPVGAGATIHPLLVADHTLSYDLPALALITVALLYFLIRRRGLQRSEAIALLALYIGYLGLRIPLN